MHEVPLLLHVVADEHLGHQDLSAGLLFFLHLSLPSAIHPLLGANIQPLSLVFIVALSFLEEGFLGDSTR